MRRWVLAGTMCVGAVAALSGCSSARQTATDSTDTAAAASRDADLPKLVPLRTYAAMDALIKEEALREPSFTEAWAWVGSELSSELWDKVGMELGLTADELERHWKDRQTDLMRRETYGSGSFIVRHPHRRGGTPKADAQLEDAWWSRAPTQQRAAFLSAYFVETSGYFFISRVEESRCDECAGRGTCETSGAPGRVVRSTCLTCNGCGVVRSVLYR